MVASADTLNPAAAIVPAATAAGTMPRLTRADASMLRTFADALRPLRRQRPSEWAENNVVLTRQDGAMEAGPYKCSYYPWLYELHDCLFTRPHKRGVVGMKGTQRGFTQALLNLIAAWLATENGNMIYAIGRAEDAAEIASRFRSRMSALRHRFGDDAGDESNGVTTFRGSAGNAWFVTAKSAGALSNKTCPLVGIDEFDQAEAAFNSKKYGNMLTFAEGRQAAVYQGAITLLWSHPTEPTRGIAKVFLELSDQSRWVFTCPRNGCVVEPNFDAIHFPDTVNGNPKPATAVMKCQVCGEIITDEERKRAVWPAEGMPGGRPGGSGRLESPLEDDVAAARPYLGFQVGSLCDPYRSLRFYAELLAAAKTEEEKQAVYNTRDGRPYTVNARSTITTGDVEHAMAGGRGRLTVPGGRMGVRLVAAGADVQMPKDNPTIYTCLAGFTVTGDVWARFGLVQGFAAWHNWLREAAFELDDGAGGLARSMMSPSVAAMDDGWEGGQVRSACRVPVYSAHSQAWIQQVPVRYQARSGQTLNADTPHLLRTETKRTDPSRPDLGAIDMYDLHRHSWVNRALGFLAGRRLFIIGGQNDVAGGGSGAGTDVPRDLAAHLTSQVLTPKKVMHNWQQVTDVLEWDLSKNRRDDHLMALCYAIVAAAIKGNLGRLHLLADEATAQPRIPIAGMTWGRRR